MAEYLIEYKSLFLVENKQVPFVLVQVTKSERICTYSKCTTVLIFSYIVLIHSTHLKN